MFCAKCGKQLDDNLKFCTACGAKVRVKTENVESTTEAATESTTVQDSNETAVENAVSEADAIENNPAVENVAPSPNESPSISEMETSVIQPVDSPNEISADANAVLPNSAFEPATTTPSYETQYVPNAYVAPQPTATYVQPITAQVVNPAVAQTSPAAKRRGHRKAIAISSVAALVVVAAVGVLFALSVFNPATPIDAESFPNDIIRGAVLDQLDEDGDGRLSSEEANEVTALVYTSEGAKFVTGGEEVDVSRVREEIAKDVEASGSAIGGAATSEGTAQSGDGAANKASTQSNASASNANNASNESSIGMGTVTTIKDVDMFPNIKTLVASDSKLNNVDISELPQLEYVDLRGNEGLSELDLSNNPNIKVLFCDPDTKLTGLEEAGLYYTDLITGMSFSKSYPQPIEVEYDSHARPIKANGYKLTYDENGRLIKMNTEDDGSWYTQYSYGNNGLLATAAISAPLSEGEMTHEFAYGYDSAGNLTQYATGRGKNNAGKSVSPEYERAGAFTYGEGKLNSYRSSTQSALFKMTSTNLIDQAITDNENSQTTDQCTYGNSGAMTNYVHTNIELDGSLYKTEYATEYSESGAPVKTTTNYGYGVKYKCNADGYIIEIAWDEGDYLMAGHTGKISYIKRVGRLEDRASERFVPVIKPCAFAPWPIEGIWLFGPENWFATSGTEPPVTIMFMGPSRVTEFQTGLFPNMLYNPNEVTLAAYDRQHWIDGLNLSGDQPITADGVSKLLEKAAKTALPVPAQTFIDDKVYGPVIQQYISAVKDANNISLSSYLDNMDKYKLIPDSAYVAIGESAEYEDLKVIDSAFTDLDSDGINELVITLPNYIDYIDKGDNALAVYAQKDGKPELIKSGGERLQCWITTNDEIVTFGGAARYGNFEIFKWDGSQTVKVGGYEYDGLGESDFKVTTFESDGTKNTKRLSESAYFKMLDKYEEANKRAKLNWTLIPIS